MHRSMLPILRVLPVGGVLLAIVLLLLALNPPDGSRARMSPRVAMVRGAMIDRNEHPEWRQFLILAAIRRADELNRLLALPDDDDQTGSITQAPSAATIPIDIGEASSTELPIGKPEEEKPPVMMTPQRARQQ
jgi:hypothetical protein